jgi:Mg-chelatase subunit ChlD
MDRYGSTDWATIPPWRQTSFFGIRAQGRVFIYVVDCSGSMADAERLTRAKIELRRAIGSLQFPQRFYVIFYNNAALPMPGGLPQLPDTRAKTRLNTWLAQIEPEGGTDPRGALKTALALQPDAVFLLSDGALSEKSAAEVAAENRRRTPIHCIDLSSGSGGDQLRKIAADSGGRYVRRP